MSKASFNYQDDYGLSYAMLKRVLEEQFKVMSDIKVEYENLKVEVKKTRQLPRWMSGLLPPLEIKQA